MLKSKRLVCGIGINDSGVDGDKKAHDCPFHKAWVAMLCRCYNQECLKLRPSYIGCSVHQDWHRFSQFRDWMIRQDWQGKNLDKDIICPGNKVYSPEKCAFVSRQLNAFLVDRARGRGEYPLGVCWDKARRKFKSQCRNPFTGKMEWLGYFDDQEEAHQMWRKRKHDLACQYAEMQTDMRVAEALRTRFI